MSKANTGAIVARIARAALAASKGDDSDADKLASIRAAITPETDKLVVAGMDQAILAAHARKVALKGERS